MKKTILLLLIILSPVSLAAQNPSASPVSAQQIAAKVDEYVNAAVKIDGFSGSVLVARDGSPVVSKGYGMANIELNVPNTPQTVFRIGSITKQFTAAGVMLLQERGKLNTNDSVCKYLTDCPAAWQPITIRHLLTHTSGINNIYDFRVVRKTPDLPITQESFIERFKDVPLQFAPGERFNYSNPGYNLLGLIVERASGKSYDDFLQENVFTPLGMKNTGFDSDTRIIRNRADGYLRQADSTVNAGYVDMRGAFGSGALVSTTEDLLLWDKVLSAEKILSRKSLDEMYAPFKDLSPGIGYAYGWMIEKQFDRQAISHSGQINGFLTDIRRFPADRVTVIVLSNNQNSPSKRMTRDLSAVVFGAPYQIPAERKIVRFDSATLDKYAGRYAGIHRLNPFPITVTNENGKLMLQMPGTKTELLAESETDFFIKMVDIQVKFTLDAEGKVTGAVVHRRGSYIPAQKIQ